MAICKKFSLTVSGGHRFVKFVDEMYLPILFFYAKQLHYAVTMCEFVLQVFLRIQTAGGGTFIPESETFIPEVDPQSGTLKEVSTCEHCVIYYCESSLLVCKTDNKLL